MKFQSANMDLNIVDAVGFLTFRAWGKFAPVARHAFSTRLGGVSQGEFASMNLSFGRGDDDETVRENYRIFCKAAGFDADSLVASAQDHHTVIRRVGRKEAGVGIWRARDMQSVDGLVTAEPGVTLVTYYADCVPLYFLDPVRRVVGLAHAGWRGTAGRIGEKMVHTMKEQFGCRAGDIRAAVGPSIGRCCYEVDEPVARAFLSMGDLSPTRFVQEKDDGKFQLDLWETNRRILLAAGVPEGNITVTDLCTRCNSGLLFSHRATGGRRGGMAAFLCLRGDA